MLLRGSQGGTVVKLFGFLMCVLLASAVTLVAANRRVDARAQFAFEVEIQTSVPVFSSLTFTSPLSPKGPPSQLRVLSEAAPEFQYCRFNLPLGIYREFIFEPIDRPATIQLGSARFVDKLGKVIVEIPWQTFATPPPKVASGAPSFRLTFGKGLELVPHFAASDILFLLMVFLGALGAAILLTFVFVRKALVGTSSGDGAAAHSEPTALGGRIVVIACVLLLLAGGVFKINGSSINRYAAVLHLPQQAQVGEARTCRSDEWQVYTPEIMFQALKSKPFIPSSSSFGPGKAALLFNSPIYHPTTLVRPQLWPFFVLDVERAFSLYWQYKTCIMLAGVFALLFFITRDQDIAALGALWFTFSAYTQWFFSTIQSMPEMVGTACLGLPILGLLLKSKRVWVSLALGALLGLVCFNFALYLYPSFQIPVVLLCFALTFAWILANRREVFDKRYAACRAAGLAVTLATAGILIGYTVNDLAEVLRTLSHTSYPPKQGNEQGGAFTLFWHARHLFDFSNDEMRNPSIAETAGFIWLAPLLLPAFLLWKRVPPLLRYALVASYGVFTLLLAWQVLRLPLYAAAPFLLNYVRPMRAWPGLGLANVVASCTALAVLAHAPTNHIGPRTRAVRALLYGMGAFMLLLAVAYWTAGRYPGTFQPWQVVCAAAWLAAVAGMALFRPKAGLVLLALPIAANNILVNPITFGMSVFPKSPVHELVAGNEFLHNAKTLVIGGRHAAHYLSACGVQVVNTYKFVPDNDFWSKADPNGKYTSIYNRAAFYDVAFDESVTLPVFTLAANDSIEVKFNPDGRALADLPLDCIALSWSVPSPEFLRVWQQVLPDSEPDPPFRFYRRRSPPT